MLTLQQHFFQKYCARVKIAYKQKAQKFYLVNSVLSDHLKHDDYIFQKDNAIKIVKLILNSRDKHSHWLNLRFSAIAKAARMIFKQLQKIYNQEGMIAKEKKLFAKIFYNREAALV